MKIVVPNQSVRHNIELFKKLVARQAQKSMSKGDSEHIYQAFINCLTGDLFFPDFSDEKRDLSKKEWKQIVLYIRKNSNGETLEIVEVEEKNRLHISALEILQETVKVLNFILHRTNHMRESASLEEELSQVELEPVFSKYSHGDLIYEAWHNIDRYAAENLLQNCAIGTFFFRKDEYCRILEDLLGCKCFTLTFLGKQKRVVDRTIVQKDKHFLFYNDDPNLDGDLFLTIDSLLENMEEKLLFPILHNLAKPCF